MAVPTESHTPQQQRPAGPPPHARIARTRAAALRHTADGERRFLWGLLGVATALALAEVVARSGVAERRYLPPPSEVGPELARLLGEERFWDALRSTADGWALGFGLAAAGGLVAGIALGIHPAVRAATASTIDFLRPVPSVAFIPVVVLIFGTAMGSKVSLAVYAAIWPVLIQVIYGIADVDPVARDTVRTLGLGPVARLRHLTWPTALPHALTGLRLAASVALVVAVAAELIIGNPGIGNEIARAKDAGAFTRMYAPIATAGIVGLLINAVLAQISTLALRHHPPHLAGRAR